MDILALTIAILAFCFTLYTYIKHERELKTLETAYYKNLNEREKKASIRAEYVKTGEWNYLVLYNDGHSPARNIRIEPADIEERYGIYLVESVFPFPVLNPNEKCKIIAFLAQNHNGKPLITLVWDDDFSLNNRKDCVLSTT